MKLKLWMRGGPAQIQFQKKGVESGDGLTGQVPGFSPNGETEVWFRLDRDGDQCTSYYKASEEEDWIEIGTTSYPPFLRGNPAAISYPEYFVNLHEKGENEPS